MQSFTLAFYRNRVSVDNDDIVTPPSCLDHQMSGYCTGITVYGAQNLTAVLKAACQRNMNSIQPAMSPLNVCQISNNRINTVLSSDSYNLAVPGSLWQE